MATQTLAAAACYEIDLGNGDVGLIDLADVDLASHYEWYASRATGIRYVVANDPINRRQISMHRYLMQPCAGESVDHINGNGLDNRRSNLRICSHKENTRNRRKHAPSASRFKGLFRRKGGRWGVCIKQNGLRLHLGTFDDEERAARQYDRAARVLFGRFAKTNEMMGLFEGNGG